MQGIHDLFHDLLHLPKVASDHGARVDDLIIMVHYLMVILFVGWGIFFIYTLYRFSKRRNPRADYHGVRSHASSWLEATVALIEAVLLVGFAVPMWAKHVDTFPDPSQALQIDVIAQQFAWNVFYPGPDGKMGKRVITLVSAENPWGVDPTDPNSKDDFAPMVNEIHVPVDKDVIVYVSSKDVIHSFKIIAMRVTQDAIPGMRIPTHFKATTPGVYQINCAQLCGTGHSGMAAGRLYVDTQEDYDKWFAEKAKPATNAAPAAASATGAAPAKP